MNFNNMVKFYVPTWSLFAGLVTNDQSDINGQVEELNLLLLNEWVTLIGVSINNSKCSNLLSTKII